MGLSDSNGDLFLFFLLQHNKSVTVNGRRAQRTGALKRGGGGGGGTAEDMEDNAKRYHRLSQVEELLKPKGHLFLHNLC